jgi:hypothetical protein
MADIKLIGTNLVDPYYPDSSLNAILASRFKALDDGYSHNMRVYSGALGNAKLAIYEDVGGDPGNKIYGDDTSRAISYYGWQYIVFNGVRLEYNSYYWLAIRQDTAQIACFDGESGGGIVAASLPWANSWPTTPSWGSITSNYSYGLQVWGVKLTPGIIGGIPSNV